MYRIYILIILLLITHLSQGQYLKMATISSWGGSSSSGNYMSQVVGQSSVIAGTESKNGTVFRQGFKQPTSQQKKTQSTGIEGDLEKGEILGITYANLVAVLTKAIQEQQLQIEAQQKKIDYLLKLVEAPK
jgi:hypothetical protein